MDLDLYLLARISKTKHQILIALPLAGRRRQIIFTRTVEIVHQEMKSLKTVMTSTHYKELIWFLALFTQSLSPSSRVFLSILEEGGG